MNYKSTLYTKKKISWNEVKEVIDSEFGDNCIVTEYKGSENYFLFSIVICGRIVNLYFFPYHLSLQKWGRGEYVNSSEHRLFLMSGCDESTETLTKIAQHFGAWFDVDDSDNLPDVYIESKGERRISLIDKIIENESL